MTPAEPGSELKLSHSLSPAPPPVVPDHELLRKIGDGSYGEVWLARNLLGTLRAVKIVWRKKFWHSHPFEREFKGIQKFEPLSREHEGLVDILQVGRGVGYFYYVMELADDAATNPKAERRNQKEIPKPNVEGEMPNASVRDFSFGLPSDLVTRNSDFYVPLTLSIELSRRGRLPISECIEIGVRLTSALDHLHRHNPVHRDVKPANIISVGGAPKLADIGLVAEVSEARSYVGTEGYIPPEGPGSVQGDLYSLGKLLYEISTGKDRHAFPELPNDLAEQIGAQQLVELNTVLLKACQPEPRARYQSAAAMRDELVLLQRCHSVRRKRVVERRLAAAKRITLAAAAVALLAAGLAALNVPWHQKDSNPDAVREHQLGRLLLSQVTDESLRKAVAHVERAIQLDPRYLPAYVTLFEIYCWNVGDLSAEQKSHKLRQIAAELLRLDPKHAAGHAALAGAEYAEGAAREAEQEMKLAIALDPNYANAHVIYGFWLSMQGRTNEAISEIWRAEDLDATSLINATVAGFPCMVARDYDRAIVQFQKAVDLNRNFALAHNWIGRAHEAKGEYLAAIDEYEKCDLLEGTDEARIKAQFQELRKAYLDSGADAYWLKLKELVEATYTPAQGQTLTEEDRWPLTGIYARLGLKEQALDLLETEYQAGHHEVFFRLDPSYDCLREELRFQEMLKRAGLEK